MVSKDGADPNAIQTYPGATHDFRLATITVRSLPFTDAIKKRADISVIEVRPNNREQLVSELSEQFMA